MPGTPPILHWLLEDAAAAAPDRPAIELQGMESTYRDLDQQSNQLAQLVSDLGAEPGDTALVFLPNRIEFVWLLFGLAKAGVIAALVDTEYRGEGLEHLISSSDADIAFVDADLLETFDTGVSGIADPPEELVIVGTSGTDDPPEGVHTHGRLGNLMTDHPVDRPVAAQSVEPSDTLHLVHTSGTTGLPKWCRLSHAALVHQSRYWADIVGIRADDRVMNPLPLYHLNPLCLALYPAVSKRATVVLSEEFSASRFWDRVREHDVTVLMLIFSVVDILLNQDVDDDRNDIRVMFPPNREFLDRFDIPAAAGLYGSTETAGALTGRRFSRPFPDTDEALSQLAGWARPDVEICILDEDDERVPQGEIGEIACRPAKPDRLFDEYYNMPEETIAAIRNLWYHT
ncbi:MAG: AMP-binding protein, partial [Salinirussus sp.]